MRSYIMPYGKSWPQSLDICAFEVGHQIYVWNLFVCPQLVKVKASVKSYGLWSIGQSSWLPIQRSGFDSRRYQIFWEAVSLERGSPSLVNTIEELLERRSSGSSVEIREYGRRGSAALTTRHPLYTQKLTLTSPTKGGRSFDIVRSRTQSTEFVY
jgi:hypothetical protein